MRVPLDAEDELTFNELKDKYNFSKEHDSKEKDDFEIEL